MDNICTTVQVESIIISYEIIFVGIVPWILTDFQDCTQVYIGKNLDLWMKTLIVWLITFFSFISIFYSEQNRLVHLYEPYISFKAKAPNIVYYWCMLLCKPQPNLSSNHIKQKKNFFYSIQSFLFVQSFFHQKWANFSWGQIASLIDIIQNTATSSFLTYFKNIFLYWK